MLSRLRLLYSIHSYKVYWMDPIKIKFANGCDVLAFCAVHLHSPWKIILSRTCRKNNNLSKVGLKNSVLPTQFTEMKIHSIRWDMYSGLNFPYKHHKVTVKMMTKTLSCVIFEWLVCLCQQELQPVSVS